MNKFKLIIIALVSVFILTGAVSAEDVKAKGSNFSISDIVLEIGDKKITHFDLYKELNRIHGAIVLNSMAEEIIIEQEAKKRKVKVTDNIIDNELSKIKSQFDNDQDFMRFLKNRKATSDMLKQQIKINELKRKLIMMDRNISPKKKDIKEYFNKNKDKFATSEMIKLSHILLASKEEANDIFFALDAGADFGKMASAKSVDDSTRNKGGELGLYRKGVLLPDLERKLFTLKKGEISQPVISKLGWHIFKVLEKNERVDAKLTSDIKDRISNIIIKNRIKVEYKTWITELSNEWVKPVGTKIKK